MWNRNHWSHKQVGYLCNFDQMLEAECGLVWEWETPRCCSFGIPVYTHTHTHTWAFLTGPPSVSHLTDWTRFLPEPNRIREEWPLLNMPRGFFLWEVHSPVNETSLMLKPYSSWEKIFFPSLNFVSHLKTVAGT